MSNQIDSSREWNERFLLRDLRKISQQSNAAYQLEKWVLLGSNQKFRQAAAREAEEILNQTKWIKQLTPDTIQWLEYVHSARSTYLESKVKIKEEVRKVVRKYLAEQMII